MAEKKMPGTLGKLKGVFGTTGGNRNDYPCVASAWHNAFSDEQWLEKIEHGGVLGRLDHCNESKDNPADETLLSEPCFLVKETPTVGDDGIVRGEGYILDNDAGRALYTLCKAGIKPGISFRGAIDNSLIEAGDEEGAWDSFTIDAFDIVYVPAYKEARLELVEDYGVAVQASVQLRSNVMKVCASIRREERKAGVRSSVLSRARVEAVKAATDVTTAKDITDLNKEAMADNPASKEDVANKAKRMTREEDMSPMKLNPIQIGNTADKVAIGGGEAKFVGTGEKEEIITGKEIVQIDKMNLELTPTAPVEASMSVEQQIGSSTDPDVGITPAVMDRLDDVAEQATMNAIDDLVNQAGITAGGNKEKKVRCNVEAEATEPDIQKVDLANLDGNTVDTDIVNDESEEIQGTPEEILKQEVGKLAETNATLEKLVSELKGELESRNAEIGTLATKAKRQAKTLAHYVDKCASLEASSKTAVEALAQTKKVNADATKMDKAQINDLKEVVASLEKDRDTQNRVMSVRADALKKVENENRVLASKGGDIAGRMALIELANVYGVSPEHLLSQRASIKSQSDLSRVIASLQRPTRQRTSVRSSYERTSGVLEHAMPEDFGDLFPFADDVSLD
jgi:hypothetical protein